MNWRRAVVGGCVVLSLVAAACGGDDGATRTSDDTSSATDDSSASDTGTDGSSTGTDGSSDTTDGSSDTTDGSSDTTDGTTAATDAPSTTAKPRRLYEELPAPELPDTRTPPVPSKGTLPDGTYWATYNSGDTTKADVDVFQAYFGAACEAKAAELGLECLDGILVLDSSKRHISSIDFGDGVTITVSHEATQKSYYVTPEEFVNVVAGSPSSKAPAGYSYVGFPFLMRIRSGKITRFRQVWTP